MKATPRAQISSFPELPDSESAYHDHHQETDALKPQGFSVVPPLEDVPVDHEKGKQEDGEAEDEKPPERDVHPKKSTLRRRLSPLVPGDSIMLSKDINSLLIPIFYLVARRIITFILIFVGVVQ